MNVCCEYYDVGCSKPVVRPIILLDLAKHVATEWMPGVPNPVIDGLAGVLYGVLEPCQIGYRNNYWCVNPNLARTDRQWRGATSWILGVAFARFAMECEGYRWWAPLSAFGGPKSTGKTDTGCWVGPKVEYSIRKKSSSSARYLPDYVVCRANGPQPGVEYAFVESKGTDYSIATWRVPRIEWSDQVRNAELLFQQRVVPVGRHLVVATRVNPEALQPSTRKVVVRLWNTDEGTQLDGGSMFAAFLAIHYAAMCRRLGYQQLEELMTSAAQEISRSANDSPPSRQGDNSLQDRERRMRELSHNVSNLIRSHQLRRVHGSARFRRIRHAAAR